ncbi:MAG: FAD-binding oxidoreductase [Fimbriimonadaceae bacterium]
MVEELSRLLSPERVLSGAAAERGYDCDAYTVDRSRPAAVVLPDNTDEVAAVIRWCNCTRTPFTARGAGTGLSGGALPAMGGVVISTKRMTRILHFEPENRTLTAQAGATNKSLSDAVASHGLHFAPDPSSATVSTLGGNIAENSGGPHTLKYGVTAGHVRSVRMVDPTGEILDLGRSVAGAPDLDFLGLIVGGEGTLGVVTEATVNLAPLPSLVTTALVAFGDVRHACETVAAIIADGVIPAALELIDKGILRAITAAFGMVFPPGSEALLLVECDGPFASEEMLRVRTLCAEHASFDFRQAANEKERQELWRARKKGIGAMGRLAPTIVTHDGVIPRSKLPEMLETVYAVAKQYDLGVANIFHAGDGNLHPCFYFDDRVPGVVDRVVAAGEAIIRRCIELGGSVSGEHGIGVEKLDMMALMFGPEDLQLQADAKAIFNSGDLCNPCKVLPNQKSCVEHSRRWRGAAW